MSSDVPGGESANMGREEEEDDPLVIDEEAIAEEEGGKEFEPSVEMMINDFDDERTLEEEEALESQEDERSELNALEREQDIPIEDLLKMYGYDRNNPGREEEEEVEDEDEEEEGGEEEEEEEDDEEEENDEDNKKTETKEDRENETEEPTQSSSRSNNGSSQNDSTPKKRSSSTPPPSAKKSKSELARFYESAIEGRSLRSATSNQCEDEDSDSGGVGGEGSGGGGGDSDLEGRDYSWKKTIMIGPSFQATVPTGLSKYGDSLPYENEDKRLWDPKLLSPDEVEDFLAKSQEISHGNGVNGVGSLPLGAHIRDDEQALFLLLQCGCNYEEALRRRRMNAIPPADTMSLWSEEECRAFELGLRLYGKDFTMIQQQKVRTRSVGELVQFYYLWKKTERHDVFANANRLEKKKYTLHPGTTDYMDRFIDEQDSSRDRSSSPNYHILLYGSNASTTPTPGDLHGGSQNSSKSSSNGDVVHTSSSSSLPTNLP